MEKPRKSDLRWSMTPSRPALLIGLLVVFAIFKLFQYDRAENISILDSSRWIMLALCFCIGSVFGIIGYPIARRAIHVGNNIHYITRPNLRNSLLTAQNPEVLQLRDELYGSELRLIVEFLLYLFLGFSAMAVASSAFDDPAGFTAWDVSRMAGTLAGFVLTGQFLPQLHWYRNLPS
jgi:hypothetical protein